MPYMTFSLHFLKVSLSVQETGIQTLPYLYSYNIGNDNLKSVDVSTKAGSLNKDMSHQMLSQT